MFYAKQYSFRPTYFLDYSVLKIFQIWAAVSVAVCNVVKSQQKNFRREHSRLIQLPARTLLSTVVRQKRALA
jgi:hypothetical protein